MTVWLCQTVHTFFKLLGHTSTLAQPSLVGYVGGATQPLFHSPASDPPPGSHLSGGAVPLDFMLVSVYETAKQGLLLGKTGKPLHTYDYIYNLVWPMDKAKRFATAQIVDGVLMVALAEIVAWNTRIKDALAHKEHLITKAKSHATVPKAKRRRAYQVSRARNRPSDQKGSEIA